MLLGILEGVKLIFNSKYTLKCFRSCPKDCDAFLETILNINMIFSTLTATENAFVAVLNCKGYLKSTLHIYMLLGMLEGPKLTFNFKYTFKCFRGCLRLQWLLRSHSNHKYAVRRGRRP